MANVEVNTWAGLQDSNNQGNNVKWTGGDLDFNDTQPTGFRNAVTLYGNIDFQGATFRNFRHSGNGYLYPNSPLHFNFNSGGYVKNLNFVNGLFNESESFSSGVIVFGNSDCYNANVINCRFDVDFTLSLEQKLFHVLRKTNYSGRSAFQQCAFKVKAQHTSSTTLYLFGFNHCDDCRIDLDINTAYVYREFGSRDSFNCGMHNSEIAGKIRYGGSNVNVVFGSDSSGTNVYRVDVNGTNQIYSGASITVYDDDIMNISSTTNVKGCTEAQLKDKEYLNSIGFQIAT